MQIISKIFSNLIILGSVFTKLPQIIKIVKKQSVFGVSVQSVILESSTSYFAIVHNLFLGNPISIYAENFTNIAQNIIILLLFPMYSKNFSKNQVLVFLPLFMMIPIMFYVREDLAQWAVYILIILSKVLMMKVRVGRYSRSIKFGSQSRQGQFRSSLTFCCA